MLSNLAIGLLLGIVSMLYGTAGQAGGSGFVAVMTFAAYPLEHIRATALALNVVAATYSTLQMYRARIVDWPLLATVLLSSVPAAFVGGMIVLTGPVYCGVTGALLLLASVLMVARKWDGGGTTAVARGPALAAGAISGIASGITGVGGGVFLSSLLILFNGLSPKKTAALSPPYILVNSLAGLAGVLLAGQTVPLAAIPFALAALIGSAIGTAIGLRWMSENAIRYVLAAILLAAAAELLARAI